MIEFVWMYAFLLLPLPWLVKQWAPAAATTPAAALYVSFYQAMRQVLSEHPSTVRSSAVFWLNIGIWLLLVTAVAQPRWMGEPVAMPTSGRDLMMAIDLSKSMQMPDMNIRGEMVDRLVAIKAVATPFIERRKGDRLGLILFGQQAYLQTPLTFDHKTLATMLNESVIGLAGDATAIGDAIGLAIKRFADQPQESRVLILMTDGANTAGEVTPQQAAQLAAQEHVRIYSIGIGATEVEVPTLFGSRRMNPSVDLDETTLRQLADLTGGHYFRAKNPDDLVGIYAQLDQLEPVLQENRTVRPFKNLFYWPLGFALILSWLQALWWLNPNRRALP